MANPNTKLDFKTTNCFKKETPTYSDSILMGFEHKICFLQMQYLPVQWQIHIYSHLYIIGPRNHVTLAQEST
jgi:hypothetical protein